MKKRKRLVGLALGLGLVSCGVAGSGESLELTFVAPDGSGFVGGQAGGVSVGPLTFVSFALAQGVNVQGLVLDGSGAPMAGVDVTFKSGAGMPALDTATTDALGNYDVFLTAGDWMAEVDPGTAALGVQQFANLTVPSGPTFNQDFDLPAALTTTGSVIEEFGPGIAGALLEFRGLNTGAVVSAIADGTGAYTADLVPDDYDVIVTPAGASVATHLIENFTSNAVATAGTLDFSLIQGAIVSGTVLDNLNNPLFEGTGIDVVLPAGSNFFAPPTAIANVLDGTYSLGPLPPGGNVLFELIAPGDTGFPRQQLTNLIPAAGTQSGVDFSLLLGSVVSGTILQNDASTPESNVLVELLALDGSLPPAPALSDGLGNYAVSVFPGTYDLSLAPEITNLQLPEIQQLSVAGPLLAQNPVLSLGSLVTGTLFQVDGITPQPGALVEIPGVLGGSTVTDASGVYSLLAPAGTHDMELLSLVGTFANIALNPFAGLNLIAGATQNQDITMNLATSGPQVVTGIVFEPDGTTGAAGVEITARNANGDIVGRALSDGFGAYALVVR